MIILFFVLTLKIMSISLPHHGEHFSVFTFWAMIFLFPLKFEFLSHFQILVTVIDNFFLSFSAHWNLIFKLEGVDYLQKKVHVPGGNLDGSKTFLPVGGAKMSSM